VHLHLVATIADPTVSQRSSTISALRSARTQPQPSPRLRPAAAWARAIAARSR